MAGDQAYLAELRKLWQQNFVAAILIARLNHERIPPETAAIAQGMDRAFNANRDINDAVERTMGSLGIFGGRGGFGASSGLDPDEYMFNAAMGMIAAHRGNPPAASALQAQAAMIVTGQLNPLSAFELSSPQLAGTGLVGGVLTLAGDMAPFLNRMGLFMAALAVPTGEIPALLREAVSHRPRMTNDRAALGEPAGSYGARARTSTMAIASLVLGIASWLGLSLLASIPAIITGHMARREIRGTGGAVGGSELAITGLIAGYANVVVSVVVLLVVFGAIMAWLGAMGVM